MKESEINLIKRAQNGHNDSFGELYDAYHEPIFRFVYLKVSHREEAEDLTHQIFLSAWQNISNYQIQDTPFTSWLYRIARNKVIDHYRLKKNKTSLDSIADVISDNLNLELALEEKLAVDQIRSALNQLSPEQQDVIIMRFIEDLPIKEVAVAINKTPGAVKLIQLRGLSKLKKILKHEPPSQTT